MASQDGVAVTLVAPAAPYDEDIVENPFYLLLQSSKFKKLYAKAAAARLTVCNPNQLT